MLREPIYVQVNVLERTDPNIILNLEHCWATSSPSPHSLPQWDLLVDGYRKRRISWPGCVKILLVSRTEHVLNWAPIGSRCPYHDDRYLTTVLPVDGSSGLPYPTHYKRFVFNMFAFVDQNTFTVQEDTVKAFTKFLKWLFHWNFFDFNATRLVLSRFSFIVLRWCVIPAARTLVNSHVTGNVSSPWTGIWLQLKIWWCDNCWSLRDCLSRHPDLMRSVYCPKETATSSH